MSSCADEAGGHRELELDVAAGAVDTDAVVLVAAAAALRKGIRSSRQLAISIIVVVIFILHLVQL